ncbi:hypothetical protein LOS13_12570 [Bacillus altitudinis]|uniref:RNA dependent RNA polymerase n=1 Tax=Bacillus altitudinis TaxID=293387 RepID=UPI0022DD3DAE|nr:hypothetical protein [Bacillus altitudinis]WBL50365.1 hypothetical protein LOS13_12570 [Bacillus altitudinis]
MKSNLSKQVYIYSLDTSAFFTPEEQIINNENISLTYFVEFLKEVKSSNTSLSARDTIELTEKQEGEMKKHRPAKNIITHYVDSLKIVAKKELEGTEEKQLKNIEVLKDEGLTRRKIVKLCGIANLIKNQNKKKMKELMSDFKRTRELNLDAIRYKNTGDININKVIGIFESTLTRTLGIETENEQPSDEIIIVESFYEEVFGSLIKKGFKFNKKQYDYYASSAGQIRDKKGVFIKRSSLNKHKTTLMCGLDEKLINSKGGMNINKWNAYLALSNSASSVWEGFDIDKAIVVPDFENEIEGSFDYIDRNTYEITRKKMTIPVDQTDGCGMILPTVADKPFQFRAPFMKGMLVPFDFKQFAKEHGKSIIKDIDGREWDVLVDDIHMILTKSQFKMWSYYGNESESKWDHYKRCFKEYNCEASKLNEEEENLKTSKLNYQMLQTLTDITDSEMTRLTKLTINEIKTLYQSTDAMLDVMGAVEENEKRSSLQEALFVYPGLLKDNHVKETIKEIKARMIKEAKAGKIKLKGSHHTFLIPDLYAACEFWFNGEKNPNGLIEDGEVSCKLYEDSLEIDVLRSPHLYREHGIRSNVINEKTKKWFITKGIYTSNKDSLFRLLQFDFDGDKALVVSDKEFVSIAKRNMKVGQHDEILPLYYEMESAQKDIIGNGKIYDNLRSSFKVNIGEFSNNISKVWNSENLNLDVIKWLTMENNFGIDYAKTLYQPTRATHASNEIEKFLKIEEGDKTRRRKLPYFFKYAKDKDEKNVEMPNGAMTVDKIGIIMPTARETKRSFDKALDPLEFNYRLFLSPKLHKKKSLTKENIDKLDQLLKEYKELYKAKYYESLSAPDRSPRLLERIRRLNECVMRELKINHGDSDLLKMVEVIKVYKMMDTNKYRLSNQEKKEEKRSDKKWFVYKVFTNELLNLNVTKTEVLDILVEYLFFIKKTKFKDTLWGCFGNDLLWNLKTNLNVIAECKNHHCENKLSDLNARRHYLCEDCYKDHRKQLDADRKAIARKSRKMSA